MRPSPLEPPTAAATAQFDIATPLGPPYPPPPCPPEPGDTDWYTEDLQVESDEGLHLGQWPWDAPARGQDKRRRCFPRLKRSLAYQRATP